MARPKMPPTAKDTQVRARPLGSTDRPRQGRDLTKLAASLVHTAVLSHVPAPLALMRDRQPTLSILH
jgi:hypothetical protein